MRHPLSALLSAFALLAIAACGSSGGDAPAPVPAPACVTIEAPNIDNLRLADLQVQVEVRFLTMSDSFFDSLGFNFDVMLSDPSPGVDTSAGASNDTGTSVGADTDAIGGISNAHAIVPQGQAGLQPLPILHPDLVSPSIGFNVTTNLGGGPCVDFGPGVTQTLNGLNPVPGGQLLDPAATPDGLNILGSVLTDPQFQVILRAVESDGSSEVLQAPTVNLFDGQAATIQPITEVGGVSDLIPEFETRARLMNDRIAVVETGPTLGVVAVVSEDRRFIHLNIAPAIQMAHVRWPDTFQLGGTTTTGIMAPILKPRGATGTVIVEDGQTVALGGTLSQDGQTVGRGVPIFADLPLVPMFMRSNAQLDLRRNLLIFVTARLVTPEPE